MEILGLGLYIFIFFWLAYCRFRIAVGWFIVAAPLYLGIQDYVHKFTLGPLPTTLLEITFGAIFLAWLIRFARKDIFEIGKILKKYRVFSIFAGFFLLATFASVFSSGDIVPALGIWRAYFLEPMLFFVVLIGRGALVGSPSHSPLIKEENREDKNRISSRFLMLSLIISTVSISIGGIYQHLTHADAFSQGLGRPVLYRVTSFFTSPNAVGLYLVPILFLLIGLIMEKLKVKGLVKKLIDYKVILLCVVGLLDSITLVLTKSDGAILAVGAGLMVVLFCMGWRKVAIIVSMSALIIGVSIPRVREGILFRDPSGQVRLSLWQDSKNYLTASPTHFVWGTGLRQFQNKIQAPAQKYNFTKIEKLLYPHNIILNFWTETGLFGMLSFCGLVGYALYLGLQILKKEKIWGACLLGMLVVIVIHGLVDVPYFKNDLAMLWWILLALIFYYSEGVRHRPLLTTSIVTGGD
jgi:hypothetical protein